MSEQARNFACVLIGDELLLVSCGQSLLDRGHSIPAVITENEQVAQWAASKQAAVIAPGGDLAQRLENIDHDWFFSIANLRLLPAAVWRKARAGAANFHDGPLPLYAGLNTPAWAILSGESAYGVTWHALADGVDTGAIHVQHRFDISSDDTALTLNTKCFEAGIASFTELLDMIEGDALVARPQEVSERKYFAKHARPAAGATIDFACATADIMQLCRGLDFGANYTNPLCLPKIRTARGAYNVIAIEAVSGVTGEPGAVVSSDEKGAVIATGDGAVRIMELSDAAGAMVAPSATLQVGETLPLGSEAERERLSALLKDVVPHEGFFKKAIAGFRDVDLYGSKPPADDQVPQIEDLPAGILDGLAGERGIVALAAALARMSEQGRCDVAFVDDQLAQATQAFPGYLANWVPFTVVLDEGITVETFEAKATKHLADLRRRRSYPADLISRNPKLSAPHASIALPPHRPAGIRDCRYWGGRDDRLACRTAECARSGGQRPLAAGGSRGVDPADTGRSGRLCHGSAGTRGRPAADVGRGDGDAAPSSQPDGARLRPSRARSRVD